MLRLGSLDEVYKESVSYNCRWVCNDLNKKCSERKVDLDKNNK